MISVTAEELAARVPGLLDATGWDLLYYWAWAMSPASPEDPTSAFNAVAERFPLRYLRRGGRWLIGEDDAAMVLRGDEDGYQLEDPTPEDLAYADTEDHILAAMAAAIGADVDALKIRDYDQDSWVVTMGRYEYIVFRTEDDGEAAARSYLIDTLSDPEEAAQLFNPSFLEAHIDETKLKAAVRAMAEDRDYVFEMADDDFWRAAGAEGMDVPEEDEDGDLPEPTDEDREQLIGLMADRAARDPWRYLNDVFDEDEAKAFALREAGIDVVAAVDDAIASDGWVHFMNTYDGESYDLPNGMVYIRIN